MDEVNTIKINSSDVDVIQNIIPWIQTFFEKIISYIPNQIGLPADTENKKEEIKMSMPEVKQKKKKVTEEKSKIIIDHKIIETKENIKDMIRSYIVISSEKSSE